MNYSDKHYVWYLAGAKEWRHDSNGSECGYGNETTGQVWGYGYIYTDGVSHGYFEGAGNGWGYSFATFDGYAVGGGAMYDY